LAGIYQYTLGFGENEPLVTGHGNPATLTQHYLNWKKAYEQNDGSEVLTLALGFSRAFSSEPTTGSGQVKLNLVNGKLNVIANGLEKGKDYAFWLEGGLSYGKESTVQKKIGTFTSNGERAMFAAQLERESLHNFFIQRVTITPAAQSSANPALLVGTPGFFQRLYYASAPWAAAGVGQLAHVAPATPSFSFLLPKTAVAATSDTELAKLMGQQIALGRELFMRETFGGNGRTCSTCHRLDNNHTIDPKYIATLPADDPLFVAETNPALKGLENNKLLRQFGLVLANVDGFNRPGVFRGVQHTLAIATSITPEADKEGKFVLNALGWSGDGAPGDGSLRLFAVGAIMQHLPKTLNRVANVDFRLPNDIELDALEAYQLSLGRPQDPDLDHLYFSSPVVQRGRELLHSKDQGTAQCKGCHFNGSAISFTTFQNGNRDTGVENMPENPARLTWQPTPVDGGFGKNERQDCGWDKKQTCYGNGEFNVTTLIEAADTAPFFHNNSVNSIEEAVAYYNSLAFHASPGANPIDLTLIPPRKVCDRCTHLESTQVVSVALFLRTINTMENVRSSNEMLKQVKQLSMLRGQEILSLAMADTEDAIEVLEGGQIIANHESLNLLKQALAIEKSALRSLLTTTRNNLLDKAQQTKQRAVDLLLTAPPAQAS
jgi:cytochrome c peroxidase